MEESDRVLLQRLVHQGDTEAFAAIMSQYAGMVYSTGLRVLGNDAQAADVTQETFFDFLKSARHLTGSLGSWLHQVATRRAIDLIRQNASRRQREHAYATDAWQETDNGRRSNR
jgi:RNA polymerase sigma factor (sigma-70 family)